MVISYCRWPRSGRRYRSTTCSCSDAGCPAKSTHAFPLNPTVSITSVSCSQCPTECPSQEGLMSLGCGRPSRKICRGNSPSYIMTSSLGVWTNSKGNRNVAMTTPMGKQRDEGMSLLCLLYTSDAADDLLCVDLGG